jgi:hypothetical protein
MMNRTSTNQTQPLERQPTAVVAGGLAVRTDLRAGFAWDDLNGQAKAMWDKLTNTVSALTTNSDTTTAT